MKSSENPHQKAQVCSRYNKSFLIIFIKVHSISYTFAKKGTVLGRQ